MQVSEHVSLDKSTSLAIGFGFSGTLGIDKVTVRSLTYRKTLFDWSRRWLLVPQTLAFAKLVHLIPDAQ